MIYNGPSIYKFGGGGGGYNDGGQLVDGDFIKVENNTISSYKNESRDPINFYFDVADGEIINSVVELQTDVSATINIYVVKNGFYYLLGNVGGNTVNSGHDYNINIIGDSFSISEVTPGNNSPEYAIINDKIYPVKEFNGLLFTTSLVSGAFGLETVLVPTTGQTPYGNYPQRVCICGSRYYYNLAGDSQYTNKINSVVNPWRVPTDVDFTQSGLSSMNCGDFKAALNAGNYGYVNGGSLGPGASYLYYENDGKFYITTSSGSAYTNNGRSNNDPLKILGGGVSFSMVLCMDL